MGPLTCDSVQPRPLQRVNFFIIINFKLKFNSTGPLTWPLAVAPDSDSESGRDQQVTTRTTDGDSDLSLARFYKLDVDVTVLGLVARGGVLQVGLHRSSDYHSSPLVEETPPATGLGRLAAQAAAEGISCKLGETNQRRAFLLFPPRRPWPCVCRRSSTRDRR